MSTSELVEAISDPGLFEKLMHSVLIKQNRDYELLIHTGVNSAGVPIKSPVDGFHKIYASSPSHYIYVQHTITDRKSLRTKWLFESVEDPSKNGDLIKASKLTLGIKDVDSDAIFTVILTSNQNIGEELASEVHLKARELGIECIIFVQSNISNFLDHTGAGHWIRKVFLGKDAELLSKDMLFEICKRSHLLFNEYLSFNDDLIINRNELDYLYKDIKDNNNSIILFVAESGNGKSIISLQILKKFIDENIYALFIPAELLNGSISLFDLVKNGLMKYHPKIYIDSEEELSELIKDNDQLIIICDDINRIPNSNNNLRKLISWSKPKKFGQQNFQRSPYKLVCPIWPRKINLISTKLDFPDWIGVKYLDIYSDDEANLAISKIFDMIKIDIPNTKIKELSKKLGNDPILIGLFGDTLLNKKDSDIDKISGNALESFLNMVIAELSDTEEHLFLPVEFQNTLRLTSQILLEKKQLHPEWDLLSEWIKEKDLERLRILVSDGRICKLIDKSLFSYRHDRVQDEYFKQVLISKIEKSDNFDQDIFHDPYYSHLIGECIAHCEKPLEYLREIRYTMPPILFESLKFFKIPHNDTENNIKEILHELVSMEKWHEIMPESMYEKIHWILLETDSPIVLEITEKMPKNNLTLLSRLRNGCVLSGSAFLGKMGFSPRTDYTLRDNIIQHADRYYRESLIEQLKDILLDPDLDDIVRSGALQLSGFLKYSEVEEEIEKAWELFKEKDAAFTSALWAGVMCTTPPFTFLDTLVEFWKLISNERKPEGRSPRAWIDESISFALRKGLSEQVIKYLIETASKDDDIRRSIVVSLERIDSPISIEFIVKFAAEILKEIEGTDSYSFWTIHLSDYWNTSMSYGRSLSNDSREKLIDLWKNSDDPYIKKQAFRMWVVGTNIHDLCFLQQISPDSVIYRSALSRRIRLGDYSVIPDILPIIRSDHYWLNYTYKIWSHEIRSIVETYLESFHDNIPSDFSGGTFDPHWVLSELLVRIPIEEAEELLEKNWDHLGYSKKFIQSALYIGTPKTLELAASKIKECPEPNKLFTHLDAVYGFRTYGKGDFLTIEHLENLVPYLDKIDDSVLWAMAEFCQQSRFRDWSEKNLAHRISDDARQRHHPTNEDIVNKLNEFESDKKLYDYMYFWLNDIEKIVDSSRLLHVLDNWLETSINITRYKIASTCIKRLGSRKDIDILYKYKPDSDDEEFIRIINDAKYYVFNRTLQ